MCTGRRPEDTKYSTYNLQCVCVYVCIDIVYGVCCIRGYMRVCVKNTVYIPYYYAVWLLIQYPKLGNICKHQISRIGVKSGRQKSLRLKILRVSP